MLWKHTPLGDHLALEQLLISARLHPAGFSAPVALGAFGFGVSVTSCFFFFVFNFQKRFPAHYRRDHPGTIILEGGKNGDKLEMCLIAIR